MKYLRTPFLHLLLMSLLSLPFGTPPAAASITVAAAGGVRLPDGHLASAYAAYDGKGVVAETCPVIGRFAFAGATAVRDGGGFAELTTAAGTVRVWPTTTTSPGYMAWSLGGWTVEKTPLVAGVASVTGLAPPPDLPNPPDPQGPPALANVSVYGLDDSALVEFDGVAGAADHRATAPGAVGSSVGPLPPDYYPASDFRAFLNPSYKHLQVLVDGLDRARTTTITVEALAGNGSVLARSQIDVHPADFHPLDDRLPPGLSQMFCEEWDDMSVRFVPTGVNPHLPGSEAQFYNLYQQLRSTDGKWQVESWLQDLTKASVSLDGCALRTVAADASRVANATLTIEPRATWHLSPGDTLYVSWEGTPFSDLRRFDSCNIADATAEILDPREAWPRPYVTHGPVWNWRIAPMSHEMWLQEHDSVDPTELGGRTWDEYWLIPNARTYWDGWGLWPLGNPANGSNLSNRTRHRFEGRFTAGSTPSDPWLVQLGEYDLKGTFLAGITKTVPSPRTFDVRVWWDSEIYHTALEEVELSPIAAWRNDWYFLTPSTSPRSWDNFVIGVIPRR